MPHYDKQDPGYAASLYRLCAAVPTGRWADVMQKVLTREMSLETALLLTLVESSGYTLFPAATSE